MLRHVVPTIVLSTLLAAPVTAIEARLPRHPAPSPDGSEIAFAWQGDLWLVPAEGGRARRLTAHPANERYPVWSRDGSMIAFASNRYGNPDVFVMPADGSTSPTRLTFASLADRPLDFTPDGGEVLFSSRRFASIRWMPGLYLAPVVGGTPHLAQPALGDSAAYSPGGEALAFVRGATKWTRRAYHGAANRELWLRSPSGDYLALTDYAGDDDWPSWLDDHTLVFSSTRAGRKNLFLLDLVTRATRQLTSHDGSDVRMPRAAADGSLVAYEYEDAIWTVRPDEGTPRRLTIEVAPDELVNPVERRVERSGAEDLAISPDGELAAFVVHGDVFVTAIRPKEDQEIAPPPTVQITATPERERAPQWSPDGKSLLFSTAREGNEDLVLARPEDKEAGWLGSFEFPLETIAGTPEREGDARFSPDGRAVAFVRGRGDLVVHTLADSSEHLVFEHWSTPDFDWSPDGAWLAYSVPDLSYNTEIWLVPAAGGDAYNVSRHPDEDIAPRFSPDGRRLVWLSRRHADTFDVYGVWLRQADDERTPEQWLELFKAAKDKPAVTKAAGDESEKKGKRKRGKDDEDEQAEAEPKPLPEVVVDLDRLWRRARPITELEGDEGEALVAPDGKSVYFTAEPEGERDLYRVRFDGEEVERLTEGGQEPSSVAISDNGKTIFYLDGDGSVRRIDAEGKPGDPVPFAARYEVDRRAERAAVFEEAWHALDDWFYDPAFHGADWAAVAGTYRPWAFEASTDADFADVMNLMLGELNASHMGYYPRRDEGGETTGWLGLVYDPTAGGPGLLVSRVLRDAPADRRDVAIEPGDRLIAIDGSPIDERTNVYALLADSVGHKVRLELLEPSGATRRAVVEPVGRREMARLAYQDWVERRRLMVQELSGGRLGYLHVRAMDIPSFERAERDLYAAGAGKEGLVIDVRSNGGGWTTDYLMAVLMVRRHAFTVPRGGDPAVRAYPQGRLPLAAWTLPALTLCNEDSYSNAEIFSHAFKGLGRGPLVGAPTFGAVISTGAATLLNGARVRLPTRGWFVAGSGVNMENHGAEPDVLVVQPPAEDTSTESDTQLERAVEILLEDLAHDPRAGAW